MLQLVPKCLQHCSLRAYVTAAAIKPKLKRSTTKTTTQPLISCKRSEFNLLIPEKVGSKFGSIALASKGWLHNKSKGDYFVVNASVSEDEMHSEMQNLNEFLSNSKLKFDERLLLNLQNELGIKNLTQIQSKGIPIIAEGNHALIAAETGCGKTLAYLLPILEQVLQRKQKMRSQDLNTPQVVIITPGRELAVQIAKVTEKLCLNTEISVKALLGGNTKQIMINPEFADIDILVATIGALSKLVTTGIYRMQQVRHLVLDEADTLLDDSFGEKLGHFLKRFPFHKIQMQNERDVGTQLILASATMPVNAEEMLKRVIDIETLEEVVSPNLHKIMPHVEQKFIRLTKADRPAQMLGIVKRDLAKKRPIIIFSNKSATSDYVSIFLNNNGVNCMNLNGDMLMKIRLGRFEQYQNGECDVLSTTDVGSRGLDTTRTRHVINFDFPLHVSDYIHRCGRIGRIGNLQKSQVTNLISSRREIDVVQRIEHSARTGGLLPNVNANIKGIINKKIMQEMKEAGLPIQEEAF